MSLDRGSYRGYFSPMTVGTKELKNRLSEYLRRVQQGETVYVTDRGRIVAELKPVSAAAAPEEEVLQTLAAEGILTAASGDHEEVPLRRRLRKGKLASRMIIEDRG